MRLRHAIFALGVLVVVGGGDAARAEPEPIEVSGGHGSPISIVVRKAPVVEVFEMLAREQFVNILLAKGIEGEVSVNLFEVSLDRAVRSIAEAAGFVAERRRGGYMIVARDDAGKDSVESNTIIRAFKVEYSEPSTVSEIVEKQLSRYGEVTTLESRRLLVVEDLPEFVDKIEGLLAEVDRGPQQIMIQAKILEITLDDTESFGIDWARTFDPEDGIGTIGVRGLASAGATGLFFDLMNSDLELAVTALDDKGRVRTLSTPSLLALENEEAEVVIGERLGFRVTTTINEVTTESVEFLETGVILKFTASVDRRGHIVLKIHPEVSTGSITDGLPSQTTTEVTTTLITENGQRVFIAGLLKDTESETHVGIPYVMDVPILGRLFRRTEQRNVNTETVVILTAHVVGDDMRLVKKHDAVKKSYEVDEVMRGHRIHMDRPWIPRWPPPADMDPVPASAAP